ncbi:hypothetical protein [Actinopolyspora mzabensis]|uniref:hypothetical protein n=1 Tax=Actinopolyspora mzabensis TaxID=995066 RepID=UPI00115FA401|nr:hypothetical protein [Actinopolyspora mzabensis]
MRKYWGYAVALVLLYGWFSATLGAGVLVLLSAATFFYALFQAPVWCCAETRGKNFCHNNASGILMGCHLREHRWQKFKMLARKSSWGRLFRRLCSGFHGVATSFSALGAMISAVAAVITLALGR